MCGNFVCGRIAGLLQSEVVPADGVRLAATALVGRSREANWHPQPRLCPRQRTGSDDFCRSNFSRPRTLINDLPVIQRADGRLRSPLQVSPALRAGSTQSGVRLPPQMPLISAIHAENVQGNLRKDKPGPSPYATPSTPQKNIPHTKIPDFHPFIHLGAPIGRPVTPSGNKTAAAAGSRGRPGLEHVLNDVNGIIQVGQHEAGKGQIVQSGQGFGQTFVITGQTTKAGGPTKAAFNHPAAR